MPPSNNKTVKFTLPMGENDANNSNSGHSGKGKLSLTSLRRHPLMNLLSFLAVVLKRTLQILVCLLLFGKILHSFQIHEIFRGIGRPSYDNDHELMLHGIIPHKGHVSGEKMDIIEQKIKANKTREHPHVNKWERYLNELSGVVSEEHKLQEQREAIKAKIEERQRLLQEARIQAQKEQMTADDLEQVAQEFEEKQKSSENSDSNSKEEEHNL